MRSLHATSRHGHHMQQRARRTTDVIIEDRGEVAAVIRWLEEHGSIDPAVVGRWTLSRLRNEKLGAMAARTFEELRRAIGGCMGRDVGHVSARLFAATFPPAARGIDEIHSQWTSAAFSEFLDRPGARFDVNDDGIHDISRDEIKEKRIVDLAIGELSGMALVRYTNYLALRHRIAQLPIGGELRMHAKRWTQRLDWDEDERVYLAVFLALRPLLEGPEAAFVERSWEELDDRELTAVVRAGLRQQDIMLNRPGRRKRIRDLLGGNVKKPARRRTLEK
jgi:hypothetical protein